MSQLTLIEERFTFCRKLFKDIRLLFVEDPLPGIGN